MAFFNSRNDLGTALAKAHSALSDTESKIERLQRDREAKLLDTDGTDEISALDRQIETQQRAVTIHQDRIGALEAEQVRQADAQAAGEYAAKVVAINQALAKRDTAAADFEASAIDFARKFFAILEANDAVRALATFSIQAQARGCLGLDVVRREAGWMLFALGRPHLGVCQLPGPSNAGLGLSGDPGPAGFSERIHDGSRQLMQMLRDSAPTQDEAA